MQNLWEIKPYDDKIAEQISNKLNIPLLIARLLVQRGVTTASAARNFLYADYHDLTDPLIIQGMKTAVERIEKAIDNHEKIIIYGDYDVDGICSVVILYECLSAAGLEVDYYVPDRFEEGYGLNSEAVKVISSQGYNLIITVDCGIGSIEEAQLCKSLGLDLIITDHHKPGSNQPEAISIINPHNDDIADIKYLAGVGVSFKLATALVQRRLTSDIVERWWELVALATVADIVPLLGENRILVKTGLQKLNNTSRLGISALLAVLNLDKKELKSWNIAFQIAPCLNAAGRLQSADLSIKLLLSHNPSEAQQLARQIYDLNQERKVIEDDILEKAILQVEEEKELNKQLLLIVAGEGWNSGVIGIVASRLTARYNRPTIVISWDEGIGKGSARSVGEFNIFTALQQCQTYLLKYGGHQKAGGLTILRENYAAFKKAIQTLALQQKENIPLRKIYQIDLPISSETIKNEFWQQLECLEPYGEQNPEPQFVLRSTEINSPYRVGINQEHLKFRTACGNHNAIAFRNGAYLDSLSSGVNQDILFQLSLNNYNGKTDLQLRVIDIKPVIISNLPKPNNIIEAKLIRVLDELNSKKPVLVLFDDYRSLKKGLGLFKQVFSTEKTFCLHGHVSKTERLLIAARMAKGEAGIFLLTRAGLYRYKKRYKLPDNLRYILLCWPDNAGNKEGSLIKSYDIERIDVEEDNRHWSVITDDKWLYNRGLVYVNNRETLSRWQRQSQRALTEIGLQDINSRLLMRNDFLNGLYQHLFTEGLPLLPMENYNRSNYILADPPYSIGELSAFLMNNNSLETEKLIIFAPPDIKRNLNFLEEIYPNKEKIIAVWQYFVYRSQTIIKEKIDIMVAQINQYTKLSFSKKSLLAVLYIMEDLNLCVIKKSSSIIAIKFVLKSSSINLLDSIYYLEGLAAKKAYHKLIQDIYNNTTLQ